MEWEPGVTTREDGNGRDHDGHAADATGPRVRRDVETRVRKRTREGFNRVEFTLKPRTRRVGGRGHSPKTDTELLVDFALGLCELRGCRDQGLASTSSTTRAEEVRKDGTRKEWRLRRRRTRVWHR